MSNKMYPSETQLKIYAYYVWHIATHGVPPSLRELCADVPLSSTSMAGYNLNRLANLGWLVEQKGFGKARGRYFPVGGEYILPERYTDLLERRPDLKKWVEEQSG